MLAGAARSAFRSHVRAYAVKSKESRHAFQVRSLHFGHVAKSFALREQPRTIAQNQTKGKRKRGGGAAGGGGAGAGAKPAKKKPASNAQRQIAAIQRMQARHGASEFAS